MTRSLLSITLLVVLAACGTDTTTMTPDAAPDAPAVDAPPVLDPSISCTALGCDLFDLDDAHCALDGTPCRCAAGRCTWTDEIDSCARLELTTEPAPDVAEVRLAGRVITPGTSYLCDPDGDVYTWTQYARRLDGVLGSYGRFEPGSTRCGWRVAVDSRTPGVGSCP